MLVHLELAIAQEKMNLDSLDLAFMTRVEQGSMQPHPRSAQCPTDQCTPRTMLMSVPWSARLTRISLTRGLCVIAEIPPSRPADPALRELCAAVCASCGFLGTFGSFEQDRVF